MTNGVLNKKLSQNEDA